MVFNGSGKSFMPLVAHHDGWSLTTSIHDGPDTAIIDRVVVMGGGGIAKDDM